MYAVVFLIIGILSWKTYTIFDEHFSAAKRQLEETKEKISQLEIANQKLEMANLFLKKTRRLAVISDIVKENQEGSDSVKTTFSFSEIDLSDNPIGEKRTFTIDGDVLYIDTMIIKFEDSFVEQGDVLKGSALCLFNRLFGEKQKPEEGFRIDAEGKRPSRTSWILQIQPSLKKRFGGISGNWLRNRNSLKKWAFEPLMAQPHQ